MIGFRIGQGYDVHRLTEGRKLILGGVEIESPLGLLGHSDADVLTHSIIDAILGAAALGDIGRHFPDTDEMYKGCSSILLLKKVARLLHESGYELCNIDSTVVLQSPKIASYIEKMRKNIADALEVSIDCISIKATTEEGLGFSGEGLGALAHAIALIKGPSSKARSQS